MEVDLDLFPNCAGNMRQQRTRLVATPYTKLRCPANVPPLALILGCGPHVFRDLREFQEEFPDVPYSTWAINDVGMYLHGRVDHLVCIEAQLIEIVRAMRAFRNRNIDYTTHTWDGHCADVAWSFDRRIPRNSGMLAIAAALNWGYSRALLVGMPMDDAGHFYDRRSGVEGGHCVHMMTRAPWVHAISTMEADIRSWSGLTARRWGAPDAEWLRG